MLEHIESSRLGMASRAQEVEDPSACFTSASPGRETCWFCRCRRKKPAVSGWGLWARTGCCRPATSLTCRTEAGFPSVCCTLDAAEAEATGDREPYRPFWFGPRETKTGKLPALVVPSAALPAEEAKVDGLLRVGASLKIAGSPEMDRVGQAVHGVIALEMIHPDHPDAVAAARRLIENFELAAHISADETIACARSFRKQIVEKFEPEVTWVEHPVEHLLENGQAVRGWV